MTEPQLVDCLRDASRDWDGVTTITAYYGGKTHTFEGERLQLEWATFGAELADYSTAVFMKGAGVWFTPALSSNGRCRDEDIEGITQISFDADGVGDWVRLRRVLGAARLAHLMQRSSSHTPERPKWHAHIPLATPWTGDKIAWRQIYRHVVGWWSAAAGLEHDLTVDPPVYGFDRCVDRLGQPWFASARRSEEMSVPDTICVDGTALDLVRFAELTGFEPGTAVLRTPEGTSKGKKHMRKPMMARAAAPLSGTVEGTLVIALREACMLGPRLRPGKYAVLCPWTSTHTTGNAFDSSTVVFSPPSGRGLEWFHCSHSHCEGKGSRDVLAALPPAALARALAAVQQRLIAKVGGFVVPGRIGNSTAVARVWRAR